VASFETIADELYALPPDQFASARDDFIKQAKAAKDQALAKELGKLRKPTLSAWLINLLWRDQREVMEQLFQLSGELSEAQARAAGGELRALMQQRREIERALLVRAKKLGEEGGANVSESVQREAQETLSAAFADPSVADEVRQGRLVKPAAYSGFGTPVAVAAPPRRAAPAVAAPEPTDFEERAAQRQRERRQAGSRRLAEAQSALHMARDAVAQATREVDEATSRAKDLAARVDNLREQLRKAEQEATNAEKSNAAAERGRELAERAVATAEKDVESAEKALSELE
jgi:hypothetical protein